MVLTRSQSAERDRLRTQSHEPRSEGGTETTQSCLLQQEEEDQEPQPESSHPDPNPEGTSRLNSDVSGRPLLYSFIFFCYVVCCH